MASNSTKTGNIGIPFAVSVTTNATTGQATVTFPVGMFSVAPTVVPAAINASGDGRDIIVTIVGAPTVNGCVVQARKSRTLAASILSLAALQGFDGFAPVAATVHVMARAPS